MDSPARWTRTDEIPDEAQAPLGAERAEPVDGFRGGGGDLRRDVLSLPASVDDARKLLRATSANAPASRGEISTENEGPDS